MYYYLNLVLTPNKMIGGVIETCTIREVIDHEIYFIKEDVNAETILIPFDFLKSNTFHSNFHNTILVFNLPILFHFSELSVVFLEMGSMF